MVPERIGRLDLAEAAAGLSEHLEKYVTLAREQGAVAAAAIPASRVTVDDRVRVKCRIPQCSVYGQSYNCPPHSPEPRETRKLLELYDWAVVFRIDVSPEVIVWEKETYPERSLAYKKVTLIANAVESAAFYDGHYLAVGFGAGSCKTAFCREMECLALKGKECRFSLRARPSMESVGMDAFRLAVELGWEVYPIGSNARGENVPGGMMMGLVLVD